MEILLSGSDWKFKGFVPYSALLDRVFSPQYDYSAWRTAKVPGNAQLDCLAHGLIRDPYEDFQSRDAEWVAERQWAYVKRFDVSDELSGRHARLVFDGIDYAARIYLNGEYLGYHENLFVPVEFDVTDKLKYGRENLLVVLIDPAPQEMPQIGWTSKVRTMKPRMCYGWDFAVRLIPVGIWKDVKLVVTGDARLTDCFADTAISEDHSTASVTMRISAEAAAEADVSVEGSISLRGEEVSSASLECALLSGANELTLGFGIEKPQLWWPNGHGPQNVYEAHVLLRNKANGEVLDEQRFTFGLKTVRLALSPHVLETEQPWCFVINGRPMFIKGWNWVPIDNMYGGDYTAKYERLIRLAKEANVNLLRVWGGGLIEKEIFYQLCDRAGIMVWQEFTLSSSGLDNDAPDDPEYLAMLRHAAEYIVRSRRNYACHTVWCGGNELTWRGQEDPAISTLHEVCKRLDPAKPYIPTSPMRTGEEGADGESELHGGWQYCGPLEHYAAYLKRTTAFHSEFGTEGAANLENVTNFISKVELWPPYTKNEIWSDRDPWWVNTPMLESMFGKFEALPEFFRFSQFVQWEGLRCIVEAGRVRKFACGGTIPWQFNEPWPNLTCTNAVDYYTMPKMAYYAVARAYAPVLVAARFGKLSWHSGETFTASAYMASSQQVQREAEVAFSIMDISGQVLHSGKLPVDVPAGASMPAGTIEWRVPDDFEELFFLKLAARDNLGSTLAENTYLFSAAPDPLFLSMRSLPETKIAILGSQRSAVGDDTLLTVEIQNNGNSYAFFVRAVPQENKYDVYFEQNYLLLAPRERGTFRIKLAKPVGNFTFAGWNTNEVSLP